MSNTEHSTEFERRTQQVLRESVDQMDGATRARLARARQAAVAQYGARSRWLEVRFLALAGALAAGVLVALVLVRQPGSRDINPSGAASLDDLELLADADAFDLGQESDLEFIEWAAAQAGQDPVGG
jgi:hypothetical protein